ncbi:MAG: hypothetical protein FGM52_03960 [Mycobacterium sp.]|nr:hypothetical protein [Mycobacterium sp.]
MRRIAMAIAAAGVIAGSLAGTQTASAASTNTTNTVTSPAQPTIPVPIITALDCSGTTGLAGCGPGWIWRDGWRGFACYVC